MTLELEMQREIIRLEAELAAIDAELTKLQGRVVNLINIKKKKEHDVGVLKANVIETAGHVVDVSAERVVRKL